MNIKIQLFYVFWINIIINSCANFTNGFNSINTNCIELGGTISVDTVESIGEMSTTVNNDIDSEKVK